MTTDSTKAPQPKRRIRGKALPYLSRWRARKLWTQAQLIEQTKLSRATIVRAERGDAIVSFDNIRRLAQALGITTDELLYADPEQESARSV